MSYRSCVTAGAVTDPTTPQRARRYAACAACAGIGYVRPDGTTYANARQAAQARRRGTSSAVAARSCECCRGAAAHRTA